MPSGTCYCFVTGYPRLIGLLAGTQRGLLPLPGLYLQRIACEKSHTLPAVFRTLAPLQLSFQPVWYPQARTTVFGLLSLCG